MQIALCSVYSGCTIQPLQDDLLTRGSKQPSSQAARHLRAWPRSSAQPERHGFAKTLFSPQISALLGHCFTTMAASCCRARLGTVAGCRGTSPAGQEPSTALRHTRPQRTKNAPEHRQNPTAFRRPLRNGISEHVVSALLKQSHCGQGGILINSFLSLIYIIFQFPFQLLGQGLGRGPTAASLAARCHQRYHSVTQGCDGWLHLGLMASSEAHGEHSGKGALDGAESLGQRGKGGWGALK